MKAKYIYATLAATSLAFVACDEDYKDWAEPQSYAQEASANAASCSLQTLLTSIDEATADEVISLAKASVEGSTVEFTALSLGSIDVPFTSEDNTLKVALSDLQSAVQENYKSLAATTRNLELTTSVVTIDANGQAVSTTLTDNTLKVAYKTSELPANSKEAAYYYVGGYNGWNLASPTKFDDNGDGTYSLTITIGDGEWFAFAPQSAVDAQDWNALFRAPSNGCTETFGYLNNDQTSGFSFNCETGGKYTFKLDMVNYTYSYELFADVLYYVGDANGWSFVSPMTKWGDTFVGYYYVRAVDNANTWGFKITNAANWDETTYGAGESAGQIAAGGGNIDLGQADGFYKITVDLSQLTVALDPITAISIIGTVNGSWDTDTDLTFNTETKVWEVTADLNAGEYKLRANHDWALSWGGSADAMTADNGANLSIAEAGNYTMQFAPNANGKGTLTITKN